MRIFRCVHPRDLVAVDVGDEGVVALHPEQQIFGGVDRIEVVDLERETQIQRCGLVVHLPDEVEIRRDEFFESLSRLVAGAVGAGYPA